MTDYLRTYGKELADRIKSRAKPVYNPGDKWDSKLYKLLKTPYQAQGDAIMGLSELFKEHDSAVVVGEMGCGKTLIGASVPYVHENGENPSRSLVMCPGHLVKKWQREILETVPGAEADIINNLEDIQKIDKGMANDVPEYRIISKDRAKLGYAWKPAVIARNGYHYCPDCNGMVMDKDGIPVNYKYFTQNKRKCPECKVPLWQADNTRLRRYPISEYIKKYLKGYFDFYVADEVHELKGGTTAQGNSFGALSGASGKTLALTGTLLGGYADDIFYILYRISPEAMKNEDIGYNEVSKWMGKYGVLERITRSSSRDNIRSKGKKGRTTIKRKPGVSPMVFSRHLMDKSVFLNLEDISDDLPPINEEVKSVRMDDELDDAYRYVENKLSSVVKSSLSRGSRALLGTYLNTLLFYPDRPFDNENLTYPDSQEVIVVPPELSKEKKYAKERELIDLIKEESAQNRKVFTYCQYTGVRDVTSRLEHLLYDEGIDCDVLKYTVKPVKREEWIKDRVNSGVQVVLANPKLVQTGLDLYDFPTLVFYQTGYSIFNLRQASRRSWRIGQDKDVKVHYLFYGNTLQDKAMQLMGSKLEASLAMEGKFSEDGLLAMTAGDDMTTAMAKALVEGLDGEGVENIWSGFNKKNDKKYNDKSKIDNKIFYVDPVSLSNQKKTKRRRKKSYKNPDQLWLDGF